jgi:hypothetical protein
MARRTKRLMDGAARRASFSGLCLFGHHDWDGILDDNMIDCLEWLHGRGHEIKLFSTHENLSEDGIPSALPFGRDMPAREFAGFDFRSREAGLDFAGTPSTYDRPVLAIGSVCRSLPCLRDVFASMQARRSDRTGALSIGKLESRGGAHAE